MYVVPFTSAVKGFGVPNIKEDVQKDLFLLFSFDDCFRISIKTNQGTKQLLYNFRKRGFSCLCNPLRLLTYTNHPKIK